MLQKWTLLLLYVTSIVAQNACDKDSSIDISKGTHLSNGDIYYKGQRYTKREYYIDAESGKEQGCICMKSTCVRKCCPFGSAYNYMKKTCEPSSDVFDPPVWDKYRYLKGVNASGIFNFVFGKMNCSNPEAARVRILQVAPSLHLIKDGKLFVELPSSVPPWMVVRNPDYCVDTFVAEDEAGARTAHLDALICFAQNQETYHYVLSSTCMLISCVFILATLAVYAWLPELRNMHGRVLMAYLSCLLLAFALLATMQILLTVNNITVDFCIGLTIVIYFALLSAFFWLNVMCFDIWWTFSGKRGWSLAKLSTRARFAMYAAYALGLPTLLTVLLAALEFSALPPHPALPMLRHQGCFIYGTSKLIYLYGPIVVLCAANMVFFVLTTVKIVRIKRQTAVLQSKESSTHDPHRSDKQRLLLYVKLFAVMGINWILEVVSAVYPDADVVWQFTDAYNVLVGLIIFIIFVCKRKILRLLKKRIKEIHQGKPDNGDLRHLSQKIQKRWENLNGPDQRGSLDTIRTSICADSDTTSVKTVHTTNL